MMKIERYYETWDEAASEAGQTDDKGHEGTDDLTFAEVVRELRGALEYSESRGPYTGQTYAIFEDEENFRTGELTRRTIHFSRENAPSKARYWAKALQVAKQ